MERKRSKGVTFWGWTIIILNILGLLLAILDIFNPQGNSIGVQLYNAASIIIGLICGILILRLKEIARKAIIILTIVDIIMTPMLLKPAIDKMNSDEVFLKEKARIMEQVKPEYQQKALENIEKCREISEKTAPIFIIIIFGIPTLIYGLALIIFFTRPKVKEQFKTIEAV